MDKELAVVMGDAARQGRKALQLTQEQVAERLGLSVEFYSRIERGRAHPSIEVFLRMVEILDMSADTLLGIDATRATGPVSFPLTMPKDSPALRRLMAMLAKAAPSTLRLVRMLLNEFERQGRCS